MRGWFGGDRNTAYQIVTACVFLLTIFSSIVVHRGHFENPPESELHLLPLPLALESNAATGDSEGPGTRLHRHRAGHARHEAGRTRGRARNASKLSAASSRRSCSTRSAAPPSPPTALLIFTIALTLFALGGLANAVLFNAAGVLIFMVCLLLGRPLHDIAYFPIQMQVIDTVSADRASQQIRLHLQSGVRLLHRPFRWLRPFHPVGKLRLRHVRPALRTVDHRAGADAIDLDGSTRNRRFEQDGARRRRLVDRASAIGSGHRLITEP